MLRKLTAICFTIALLLPLGVYAQDELYLGGDSIGIEAQYDGVMISGTYAFQMDGSLYDPKDHGIKIGDIITSVNNVPIHAMEDLYTQLSNYQNERNEITLGIQREGQNIEVPLYTIYNTEEKTFQSGLYIKDKISGVGTMTFYDPAHQTFGALGHEIMDSDLKKIADIHQGSIYPAQVTSITRAQEHVAGEKHATIQYEEEIAKIRSNTIIGIYGTYSKINQNDPRKLPWATQAEMHTGKASIYTVLDGEAIQAYEIEITKLHKQSSPNVKGIEFIVTDPALLSQTNGIIQGMSGSPIVQDDHIIGAITHVVTSDPIQGYGVYIEWMLEEANKNS